MPYCPNPDCSHRRRLGEPAEFNKGASICSDCGSKLAETVPHFEPAQKSKTVSESSNESILIGNQGGLLTIRAFAIYAVIRALEQIGKSIQLGLSDEEFGTIYKIIDIGQLYAPSLILLASSALLWFWSPLIATKAFGKSSEYQTSKIPSIDIKALVYSAIGLLVIVETIPELIKLFIFIFATVAFETESKTQMQRNHLLIVTLLKLGLGTWLLL